MAEKVKLLKALGNENRLAIFEYLRRHDLSCDERGDGCTVGDIAQQYDLALSTVSHHIKELKDAGLIKCVQRGQFTYCAINQAAVDELSRFFSAE
jgi:ArsR family transcriptional regulator